MAARWKGSAYCHSNAYDNEAVPKILLLFVLSVPLAAQNFRTQEIDKEYGVIYAIQVADLNGDKLPDIVAVHNTQVAWYQNPTWQKHVIADKVTPKDNVAIAIYDINGDGRLDIALAGDWEPSNTESGGTLHWLRNTGVDGLWPATRIGAEPTLHRLRFVDVDGDQRPELIALPLHGRLTKAPKWDQAPLRVLVYKIPANPSQDAWPVEVADDTLHETHNFLGVDSKLIIGSKAGLFALTRLRTGQWTRERFGDGQPGEVKLGRINAGRVIASVEPYHGNTIAIYEEPAPKVDPQAAVPEFPAMIPSSAPWTRKVIESQIFEGHALGWGDFDGDGSDELIAGWRGRPTNGVALYKRQPDGQWKQTEVLDSGGMACEDLVVADLNNDGLPEVIAGGRATRNVKIYWNQIKPQWKRHVIAQGFKNWTAIAGDFTGDRQVDVITNEMATKEFRTVLYAAPDWQPTLLMEGVQVIHSGVMDVDGDGDLDFIGCRYSPGLIFWLERPKNPLTDKWPYHVIDDSAAGGVDGIHGLILGDVDRDGKLDVIGNSAQPKGAFPESLAWFKAPKNVRTALRWERHVFADKDAPGLSHYHGFGDLNGDGLPDIASAAKLKPAGNWFAWWQQPKNGKEPWTKHVVATDQEGATNIHVADVNRDGKPDLLASRGHGYGLVWYESPNWTPHEINTTLAGPHSLAIGDIDGDGDVDAVTCAKDSRVAAWFRNDGHGHFTQHNIHEEQGAYDIRLVDMDGDGDLDVLVAGQESANVVWYENRLKP